LFAGYMFTGTLYSCFFIIHASLNVSSGREVLLLQGVLSELRTSRSAVYRTLEQMLTKQGILRSCSFQVCLWYSVSYAQFTPFTGFPIRIASYRNSLLPKTIILSANAMQHNQFHLCVQAFSHHSNTKPSSLTQSLFPVVL
jgi:hypothetical protein